MKVKSERTGKFLFLLLLVGLIGSSLSFVCSTIHAWNEDYYFDYIEWIDVSLSLFTLGIALLSVIFFLIWIFRVHRDFRDITTDYPITPGGALRRIMIPLYNIVGMWSVYSSMARYLVKQDDESMKHGQKLMGLIPFYYFGQMVYNGLNRAMVRNDNPPISLELWTVGLEIFVSLMYISMFLTITDGLKAVRAYAQSKQTVAEESAGTEAVH